MLLDRAGGGTAETPFYRFADRLGRGDLLVLNDSAVRPARLYGRRLPGGGRAEVLLLGRLSPWRWRALLKGRRREGLRLALGGRKEGAVVERCDPSGEVVLAFDRDGGAEEAMARDGFAPLPPYMHRSEEEMRARRRADLARYQTVYAGTPGSVAAPTAGLHFTRRLLDRIKRAGARVAMLTLHVGPGTFRPLAHAEIDRNRIEGERVFIPAATARAVARTRAGGGRVIAVGTTVTRALEGAACDGGTLRRGRGTVDLMIRPGHRFRVVDALLTNFHLPRSSLLLLVCAFAGRARVLGAYREAVRKGFRFYSYGDAMFIE